MPPGVCGLPNPPGPVCQAASSKAAVFQTSAGLSSGVAPGLRRRLAGGQDGFLFGKMAAGRRGGLQRVELDQRPIVGEQAVGFGFDIGQLGVDGGGQVLRIVQFPGGLPERFVAADELGTVGGVLITKGFAGPGVAIDLQPQAAKLA